MMSLQERTLVVRNFDHEKLTHKLLKELCIQGGPVKKVVIREDHAFVEYEDVESVGYSKALLDGVCLFGEKLSLEPRVRSQTHLKYHDLLNDYINHDRRVRMMQQPQPVVWESQQQPPPTMWENFQQMQQQQQLLAIQQQQLLSEQSAPQPPLPKPVGQFDVYGQFFMQSQQHQNNIAPTFRNAPHEYQPPTSAFPHQDLSNPNQNFFVPHNNDRNHRSPQQYHQNRSHHSNNHNLGRSRSFNHHQSNSHNNRQSNNRRQSAQDFKNRRR